MLVGLGGMPATAAPSVDRAVSFTDVPADMMYHREMSWLGNEGISMGWADGTYRPLQAINRDAMAAFLYRLAGSPDYTAPKDSPFKDVKPGQQHYKEMAWLFEQGISTGWKQGDGSRLYRPVTPINRDAMAAFLYRFQEAPEFQEPATSPFTDITASTQFYKEMSWLHAAGIATGWDNGDGTASYRPLTPINRDAMAAYLYRLSLPPVEQGVVLAPETIVVDAAQHVEAFDAAASTVTVAAPSTGAPDVDAGDVLVSGFAPTAPDGMLVRVDEVATAADGTQVVQVHPATLPDAIYDTEGLVSTSGTVVAQEFIPAEGVEVVDNPQTPGGAASVPNSESQDRRVDRDDIASELQKFPELGGSAAVTVPVSQKTFKYKESLTRTTSGKAWKAVDVEGTGTLALTSEFGIDTSVNADLDIRWASLREAKFTLDTELASETTARASGELIGSAERSLGSVDTWAHVQVGPIPVAVQFTSSIDLNARSQWNADAFVTTQTSTTTATGMSYKNGAFEPISTTEGAAAASFQGPQLTSESMISVGPTLTAKLYGMAGLTGGIDAYASYTTGPQICAHEAGLQGRVGVIAGVEVLGVKLTEDWKKELTHNVVLWEGDSCTPLTPPVQDVTQEFIGSGVTAQQNGGAGDAGQWGRATNYGPGGAAWILSTGHMQDSVGPAENHASTSLGSPGNQTLSDFIGGAPTYDAASYWADVVPTGDTLHIRYFFASEEYPEYVGSQFNDVMGVFVNGKNCAVVPGTDLPIAINNVNHETNAEYYIDNTTGNTGYNTAMDGLTTPLTCSVPVEPDVPVRVEIAIADTGDDALDSAIALLDGGIWSD